MVFWKERSNARGGRGVNFSKIDGNGRVSKFFLEKVGLRQNGARGLSRNGGLPYYIEVFLDFLHDATQVNYLFFVNKHVLQNNCLNKI